MLAPLYPWLDADLLLGRPRIGSLMSLCEENYALLLRLMADLRGARGSFVARRPGNLDLHLDICDQAPYTTALRLTYYIAPHDAAVPEAEPDARLRAYHDARQVEVLNLRPRDLGILAVGAEGSGLLEKWRANQFLSKWLTYCLQQGYRFDAGSCIGPSSPDVALSAYRGEPTPVVRVAAVAEQGALRL